MSRHYHLRTRHHRLQKLGMKPVLKEFYLRTSRLDLMIIITMYRRRLPYHINGRYWTFVIEGFGGMRVRDGKLAFQPFPPGKMVSIPHSTHRF